jgi:hypothetical protein
VGERVAHQRESMQNLVKTGQTLANTITQAVQARQQRDYQQVVGNYMGLVKGLNDAQGQIQQGQQMMDQGRQKLQANPQGPDADAARQMMQQGANLIMQGQQSMKQNQTNLNDLANDKKKHKIIEKAFGIDDKNANSPERQALIATMQKQMGVGPQAAGLMSRQPQTMQLSPEAQQQQMARQAGVIGAPATAGQQLAAATQLTKTEMTESGKDKRAQSNEEMRLALQGQKLVDGKPVSMTPAEIAQHPLIQARLDASKAQTEVRDAQAQLDDAKRKAIPEQIKLAEGRLSIAQGNLGMRQKEFGIKVDEEARKQYETSTKFGGTGTPDPSGKDVESITGGRPMQTWAQEGIGKNEAVRDQIETLKAKIETLGLKDNDQVGYLFPARLKYALWMGGEEGKLSEDISQIELDKVVGAARILAGSSRALPALQQAMIHLPDAWKGSPKQMYQQLTTVEKQLQQMNQEYLQYGTKYQKSGDVEQRLKKSGGLPGTTPSASPAKPMTGTSKPPDDSTIVVTAQDMQ